MLFDKDKNKTDRFPENLALTGNRPFAFIDWEDSLMKRCGRFFVALFLFFLLWGTEGKSEASAEGFYYPPDTDGQLVVVIDAGHGGKNLGADYNGFLEKEMNMTVANAMYEELSKYEGITVYLTHTEDTDMSIQARADFAASVNADFVFCLHFNMSPENKLFGSEVWVSAFGELNREGYRFGCIQMDAMKEMGLFIRGVKTRFNDKGEDYYGILRFCNEYDIAAALIEHCHIDHDTDVGFCDSEEDLIAFGVADATSAAKFFGLKSEILGVDYSGGGYGPDLEADTPGTLYVQADETDPDICMIEESYVDLERHVVGVTVTGHDYDSPMLYYSYSIDGGTTYTPYLAWPETDVMAEYSPDIFTFEVEIPEGISPAIVVRAVNQYDRYTESNVLTGFPVFVNTPEEVPLPTETESPPALPEESQETKEYTGFKAPEREKEEKETSFLSFLELCLLICIVLFVALLITRLLVAGKRRHKRKKGSRK